MALCRRVQRRRDHHHDAVRVWPYEVYCEALEGEDRPRRRWDYRQVEEERPLPQELKLRVAEAYLHGEGDRKALALKHGVRNSARIRDRVRRYRGRGESSLRQAGNRAAYRSGDMQEISVQIWIPTRCHRIAQSDGHSYRR